MFNSFVKSKNIFVLRVPSFKIFCVTKWLSVHPSSQFHGQEYGGFEPRSSSLISMDAIYVCNRLNSQSELFIYHHIYMTVCRCVYVLVTPDNTGLQIRSRSIYLEKSGPLKSWYPRQHSVFLRDSIVIS